MAIIEIKLFIRGILKKYEVVRTDVKLRTKISAGILYGP
jgi:hypothetical protein